MALDNIDDKIIIGLMVIWNIFLIGSSYLFYHLRHNLTIKFRNVPLTLLGVLSTILISNTYFMTILKPATVPCHFVLWVLSLGAPTWFLTFFGKYFLLAFSYQHAKSKLKANSSITFIESKNEELKFNNNNNNNNNNKEVIEVIEELKLQKKDFGLGRNWYHQNRNRWTTQSVCVCIIIMLGFHAVVAALTQWLDPNYHALAKPQIDCIQGNGMIPLFITAILYFGVGGPFLVILLWPAKDAYWLKMELVLLVLSTSPIILLFLLFTYIIWLQERFYPVTFLFGFHFLTHCSSILLPVMDVYLNHLNKTPNNYLKFHQMLKDPDQFSDFKEFTVSDFTIENPLFYEAYLHFLIKYDPSLINSNLIQNDSNKINKSILPKLIIGNKWNNNNNDNNNNIILEEIIATSSLTNDKVNTNNNLPIIPNSTIPNNINNLNNPNIIQIKNDNELRAMTPNETRELIQLYEKFIAPGSDYQLNLNYSTIRKIKLQISEQNYHPLMLMPALNEVIDSMYRNTYVRFIKFQQF